MWSKVFQGRCHLGFSGKSPNPVTVQQDARRNNPEGRNPESTEAKGQMGAAQPPWVTGRRRVDMSKDSSDKRPKANDEEDCSFTRNGERWGGSVCPRALESILPLGADFRRLCSELCERTLLLIWAVKLGYHCYEGPQNWYTWIIQCLLHSYFTNTLCICRKLSCFFGEVWLWLLKKLKYGSFNVIVYCETPKQSILQFTCIVVNLF